MAVGGLFKYAQRAWFSKPTPERQLLKLVKNQPIRRVVELGVESVEGTVDLLATLIKQAPGEVIAYTAIDPFDERPESLGPLPLVRAYRAMVATGAKVRLHPGAVGAGVVAEANSLGDTDLVLLSRGATDGELAAAWFYLPRMCHPGTLVLRRVDGEGPDEPGAWEALPLAEVAARAAATPARHAA